MSREKKKPNQGVFSIIFPLTILSIHYGTAMMILVILMSTHDLYIIINMFLKTYSDKYQNSNVVFLQYLCGIK